MKPSFAVSLNEQLVIAAEKTLNGLLFKLQIYEIAQSPPETETPFTNTNRDRTIKSLLEFILQQKLQGYPSITDSRVVIEFEKNISSLGITEELLSSASVFYDNLLLIADWLTSSEVCGKLGKALADKTSIVTHNTVFDNKSLSMLIQREDDVINILRSNNWLVFIYAAMQCDDFWNTFIKKGNKQ